MASVLQFYCIICGSALTSEAATDRRLMDCPTCKHTVPIPAPLDVIEESGATMDGFPPGVLSLEVRFLCSGCRCKIQIDARWEGRVVNCPKCQRPASVPRWSRRPGISTVTLSPAEVDYLTGSTEVERRSQSA